eukprot:753828-Hanusia_phi.AAC.1
MDGAGDITIVLPATSRLVLSPSPPVTSRHSQARETTDAKDNQLLGRGLNSSTKRRQTDFAHSPAQRSRTSCSDRRSPDGLKGKLVTPGLLSGMLVHTFRSAHGERERGGRSRGKGGGRIGKGGGEQREREGAGRAWEKGAPWRLDKPNGRTSPIVPELPAPALITKKRLQPARVRREGGKLSAARPAGLG